jgi:translation initiation factor RLI1
MRIAVLKKEKCTKGDKCEYACKRFCPRVRAGDDTIAIGEDGYPIIDEQTSIGNVPLEQSQ